MASDDGWTVVSGARTSVGSRSVVSSIADSWQALQCSDGALQESRSAAATTAVAAYDKTQVSCGTIAAGPHSTAESALTIIANDEDYLAHHDAEEHITRSSAKSAWHGKSVCRSHQYVIEKRRSCVMQVGRPSAEAGTVVDEALELPERGKCLYQFPRQPLHGAEVALSKNGRWGIVQLLQDHALSTTRVFDRRTGVHSVQYELPVTGVRDVSSVAAGAMRRRQLEDARRHNTVYEVVSAQSVDNIRVRVIGAYPLRRPDPDNLVEVPALLRAPRGSLGGLNNARRARCRNIGWRCYFAPEGGARGKHQFLEVDLMGTVDVAAVSIAARPMATSSFPTSEWLREKDVKRYTGQRYNVLRCAGDEATQHFYRSFDVAYRTARGTPWIRLGTFRGPRDNFEERVVMLRDADNCTHPAFTRCCALRFSVAMEGVAAPKSCGMRVAVFKLRVPPPTTAAAVVLGDSGAETGLDLPAEAGDAERAKRVTYTVPASHEAHLQAYEIRMRRYSDSYTRKERDEDIKLMRRTLRNRGREEARECGFDTR